MVTVESQESPIHLLYLEVVLSTLGFLRTTYKMSSLVSTLERKHISVVTSNGIDHSSHHSHTEPTPGLVERGHCGPVVAEGVESLHTAEGSTVTPASSLQSSVPT